MTSILLFFVVVALLGFLGWQQYDHARERERLINRLLAKTASEVRVLDNEPRRPDRTHPVFEEQSPEEREFWADFSGQTGI